MSAPDARIAKMKNKENIYLWTGTGWGKTTSALGVAMRAIGHGRKVEVVQFMKGRRYIGEYKIQAKMKGFSVHQFGTPRFIDIENPSPADKARARAGLEFAKEIVKTKPFLLILDEINLACVIGLLDTEEVAQWLATVPKSTTIYLTGRFAPKRLIDLAAYVTEIRPVKHPPITGRAKKGIDY